MTTPNEELQALLTELRDSRLMRLHGDTYMPRIEAAIAALARHEEGREAVYQIRPKGQTGWLDVSQLVYSTNKGSQRHDMRIQWPNEWLDVGRERHPVCVVPRRCSPQDVEPPPRHPQPSEGRGGDHPSRPCRETAERAISHYLAEELGFVPDFNMVEDGQEGDDPDKIGWAFWIEQDDTTSYVHNDLRIEWYGTATPTPQSGEAHPDALPDGTLSKSTMKRLATLPEPTPTVVSAAAGAAPEGLFALHLMGPDDVYAAPSYEAALRVANAINLQFADHQVKPYAVVVPWMGTPEHHAADLPNWERDFNSAATPNPGAQHGQEGRDG